MLLHGSLGVHHCLPGAGDVQEDGVCHTRHSKPIFAHILVPDGDQVIHPVLLELLSHLLRPRLVELYSVQVTCGSDGPQDGMGERAAACTCNTDRRESDRVGEQLRKREGKIFSAQINRRTD